ncbi:MAG: hypothetical protein H0T78_02805 [Longispora sp.]|nr:hypothetical protein [Longispora sp. (in: high G+C Gram-positive bacteria)]
MHTDDRGSTDASRTGIIGYGLAGRIFHGITVPVHVPTCISDYWRQRLARV